MSDYDFPDLPSDEELGITDADRELLEKEGLADGPELSEAEMKALLGDVPAPKPPASDDAGSDPKAARRAEKQRRKEAKRLAKEVKKRERAAAAQAKAEKKAGNSKGATPPAGTASGAAAAASGAGPSESPKSEAGGGADGGEPPVDGPGKGKSARPPERPRSRWRGAATLTVLIAVAWVSSARTGQPRPVTANAPDTAFSSARAMATLIEIAAEAHPPGSPEHARVRSFLIDRLRSLGLDPEVQTTTAVLQRSTFARTATVRNVLARIPGTDPSGAVLLTAHYDGRELSHGAGDDGAGVVAIIETVRALQAGDALRNDVLILLTDGEELGLLGARAFVDEHPWMNEVALVLSFEMRGGAGPSIMFETKEDNGWVVRALKDFDPRPFANSMGYEVYQRMPNDTDFTPFREAGKQGLNFAAIDNAHIYHQAYDEPQYVSEATIQHHGIHALAATRYFGDIDLASVDAPNVVYFNVPFLGLIVYGQPWVLALSAALILLLIGALLLARRSGARPSRMGLGFGVSLIGIGLSAAGAFALTSWLPRFHPEAGSLHGSLYHTEGWYVLAIVCIAFAAVTGLHAVSRRWLSMPELALGAVLAPLVAAVVLGFVAPLAAMNFQWPVLAALVAISTAALLGARSDASVGWIVATLAAIPVFVFLVPVTELLWLALTFRVATALSVLAALALYLCLPALDALRHPNGWWAPLAGLTFAALAVGMGLIGSRPNGDRPAPSTLVYAYEHGTGAAIWATDPNADSLDADARAWAEERASGAFEGLRDLSGFAYFAGQTPTSPAPVVSAAPPEVVLTRDAIEGRTRFVTLEVRSRIGAEYLAFVYDAAGSTRVVSINGKELADPASLTVIDHWGAPEPVVELELEMPEGEAIGLHVVEHLLRPTEVLGADAFARPPHLAPDITRMSDRAMFRYSVGAFADPRHAIVLPGRTGPASATPMSVPDSAAAGVGPDTSAAVLPERADSIAPGAVPADTIRIDTISTDSIRADTIRTDTLPTDTVRTDTVRSEQ